MSDKEEFPIDYRALLLVLVEDLGGEIIIPKSRMNEHKHILNYYEGMEEIRLHIGENQER